MAKNSKIIHPSWRSKYQAILMMVAISYMIFAISPSLEESFDISLKALWFIPLFILANTAIQIYDTRYSLEADSIISVKGVLSLFKQKSSVRYEDIRSLEVTQTIMGRLLGFGSVEIGTAASAGIEIEMLGVARPLALLKMIEGGRDLQELENIKVNTRIENG